MTALEQPSALPPRPAHDFTVLLVLILCFFGAYLINIGGQDLTNASENVVIQAAIETRQGAPWWVPNLLGKPRILKPPYPTWIAAAAMSRDTLTATAAGDIPSREAAYHRLAAEARWPSALCSGLTLLGVYLLGRIIADRQVGLAAALICGSTVLLLRFGRMANTDIQLTMWVAWANVCLAAAVLRGKWLAGCAGAGVCLGMAMMSKGPVGLLQSVLPIAAFIVYARFIPVDGRDVAVPIGRRLAAIALGLVLLLAIAVPWPVSVMLGIPGAFDAWVTDVFSPPGTSQRERHWWGYIAVLPNMLPWIPLFIAGLCLPVFARFRKSPIMLAWLLFVVPIVAQSLVRDKNERYAMPMVPAAAILCAFVAIEYLRNPKRSLGDRITIASQWLLGFALAATILAGALPIAGNPARPWYGWTPAIIGSIAALFAMLLAAGLRKRHPWIHLPAIAAVSLIVYHLFMIGYVVSPSGRSAHGQVALKVATEWPGAQMLFFDPRPDPRHVPTDLPIYAGGIVTPVKAEVLAQPPTGPQILFTIAPRNEPAAVYPGWELWFGNEIEKRMFWVYRRTPERGWAP